MREKFYKMNDYLNIYQKMYTIRVFESKLNESITNTALSRYNHDSLGREAVSEGFK